ncbi:MAG: DUF4259 domain-containing protein [Rhodobacteraceae bacterium]|nr:MAG: DUF4259 domain-containing protein [Paracoccaceae bacterium]
MGTFGPGPLDNDTALDFLSEAERREDVLAALEGLKPHLGQSVPADLSERALAAAELVAFAMGRGRTDTAARLDDRIRAMDLSDLVEAARESVSGVMMGGELLDLWGEGDPAEFNSAISDLIDRLNPEVPYTPEPEMDDAPKAVCCFCNSPIGTEKAFEIDVRFQSTSFSESSWPKTAHVGCLNARLDPRHFVQAWTIEDPD